MRTPLLWILVLAACEPGASGPGPLDGPVDALDAALDATAPASLPDMTPPPKCAEDLDCYAHEACVEGRCVQVPAPQPCQPRPPWSFTPQEPFAVRFLPRIALHDLDGDGQLDLFADSDWTGIDREWAPGFYVFRGGGNGTFHPPIHHPAEIGAFPAFGDLDGDGRLDLARMLHDGRLEVWLGVGEGRFESLPSVEVGLHVDLRLAHVDHDALLDRVAWTEGGQVVVALGNGDGTFRPGLEAALNAEPAEIRQLVVGQLDGDGHTDLVVSYMHRPPEWRAGQGDGRFQPPSPLPVETDRAPLAADWNGDGFLDLVTTRTVGEGRVRVVYRNRRDGTFEPVDGPTQPLPGTNFLNDINGDGHMDLVLRWLPLHVALGDGTGRFWNGPAHGHASGVEEGLDIGDLNQDGRPDLVVATHDEVQVLLAVGGPEPAFQPVLTLDSREPAESVSMADLDGDGRLDLITSGGDGVQPRDLTLYRGRGDGTFLAPRGLGTSTGSHGVGDFDADGVLDLVALRGSTGWLWPGLGRGGFGVPRRWPGLGYTLAAADLDADGHLDIVAVGDDTIRILPGLGDGRFGPVVEHSPGHDFHQFLLGEFNEDGYLDLVVWRMFGTAHLLLQGPDGGFADPVEVTPVAYDLTTGDVDGDGHLDLVGVGQGGLAVLRGRGDGTFEAQWGQSISGTGRRVQVADVTADGQADLVIQRDGHDRDTFVRVLPGVAGGFGAPFDFYLPTETKDLAVADLNGDGRLDIVLAHPSPGAVSVLLATCVRAE